MRTILAIILLTLIPSLVMANEPRPLQDHEIAEAAASSIMIYKNRDYGPRNVLDGDAKTIWAAEGDGDGVGQWVEFKFTQPFTIKKLGLINGSGISSSSYQRNNKITKASLHFADGSTQTISPQQGIDPQTFDMEEVVSDSVKMIIEETTLGEGYHHTCVSEVTIFVEEIN